MTIHEYLMKARQDDAPRAGERDRLLLEARQAVRRVATAHVPPLRRGGWPRCLDKLRRDPVIAALINAEAASAEGELSGQAPARL